VDASHGRHRIGLTGSPERPATVRSRGHGTISARGGSQGWRTARGDAVVSDWSPMRRPSRNVVIGQGRPESRRHGHGSPVGPTTADAVANEARPRSSPTPHLRSVGIGGDLVREKVRCPEPSNPNLPTGTIHPETGRRAFEALRWKSIQQEARLRTGQVDKPVRRLARVWFSRRRPRVGSSPRPAVRPHGDSRRSARPPRAGGLPPRGGTRRRRELGPP